MALLSDGEEAEAMGHFEALLDLNKHDNQGVRYDLAAALHGIGIARESRKLLERVSGRLQRRLPLVRPCWNATSRATLPGADASSRKPAT